MKLDPNNYSVHVPKIKSMCELGKGRELSYLVSTIAAATGAPALAIALWMEHLYGSSFEMDAQILSLISFYKYDKVEKVNTGITGT